MAVEAAVFISQLNQNLPGSGGVAGEGDDHLRMVKKVLLDTIPFTEKVNATAKDINLIAGMEVAGLTTADLVKLAAIDASAQQVNNVAWGTDVELLFYMNIPPPGWSASAIQAGSGIQVVSSGTNGGSAGSPSGLDMASSVGLNHSHGDTFSAVAASVGSHNHGSSTGSAVNGAGTGTGLNSAGASVQHTHPVSSDGGHTHAITLSGAISNSSGVQFNFKYMNVIVCNPTVI